VEYAGEILSRYDVERAKGANELRAITRPRLFETSHVLAQSRLFGIFLPPLVHAGVNRLEARFARLLRNARLRAARNSVS
jgi:hypothetical protein